MSKATTISIQQTGVETERHIMIYINICLKLLFEMWNINWKESKYKDGQKICKWFRLSDQIEIDHVLQPPPIHYEPWNGKQIRHSSITLSHDKQYRLLLSPALIETGCNFWAKVWQVFGSFADINRETFPDYVTVYSPRQAMVMLTN